MIKALFALPLLLLAPVQPARSQTETVTVTLANFSFAPNRIELHPGQSYQFHIVNSASGGHNFDAPEFFKAATIDPQDSGLVKDGKIEIAGGKSADVRFVAPAAGDYELHCSHFLHASMGMKGTISVH